MKVSVARCRRSLYAFFLGLPLIFMVGVGLFPSAMYLKSSGLISETLAIWVMGAGLLVLLGGLVWVGMQGFRLLETFIWCPRCGERNEFVMAEKFVGCCHCSQPLIRQRAMGAVGESPGG
jgi:hypothetical protein